MLVYHSTDLYVYLKVPCNIVLPPLLLLQEIQEPKTSLMASMTEGEEVPKAETHVDKT